MKKTVLLLAFLIFIAGTAAANTLSLTAGGGTLAPAIGLDAKSVYLDSWASYVDRDGNLYVAEDEYTGIIPGGGFVRINVFGTIDRIYIDEVSGKNYNLDDIFVDNAGNVFLVIHDSYLLKISNDNNESKCFEVGKFDGIRAIESVSGDHDGNIFLAAWTYGVGGTIYKLNGNLCTENTTPDAVIIYETSTESPDSLYADSLGNLYFYTGGPQHQIKKITPQGNVVVVAGNGLIGNDGDGQSATAATMGNAYGITGDKWGNLFFTSNTSSYSVRKVDSSGTISTVVTTELRYGRMSSDAEGMLYLSSNSPHGAKIAKYHFSPASIKTPSVVNAGQILEIDGRYFGKSGSNGSVRIGGSDATIKSWSHDRITCVVPGVKGNNLDLVVTRNDGQQGVAKISVK